MKGNTKEILLEMKENRNGGPWFQPSSFVVLSSTSLSLPKWVWSLLAVGFRLLSSFAFIIWPGCGFPGYKEEHSQTKTQKKKIISKTTCVCILLCFGAGLTCWGDKRVFSFRAIITVTGANRLLLLLVCDDPLSRALKHRLDYNRILVDLQRWKDTHAHTHAHMPRPLMFIH